MPAQPAFRENVMAVSEVRVAQYALLKSDLLAILQIAWLARREQTKECPRPRRPRGALRALNIERRVEKVPEDKSLSLSLAESREKPGVRDEVAVITSARISLGHAGCPEPLPQLPSLIAIGLTGVVIEEHRESCQHVRRRKIRLVVAWEPLAQVIDGGKKRPLIVVPKLTEFGTRVFILVDPFGPAARHGLQFWRVAVGAWPFRNKIESHQNRLHAHEGEPAFPDLVSKFLRHRTNIELSHQSNRAIRRGDAHPLRVDADEYLANLVKRCSPHRHYRNRVVE